MAYTFGQNFSALINVGVSPSNKYRIKMDLLKFSPFPDYSQMNARKTE
jgi:hypothetical protein